MEELISVIIPSYNREKTIEASVRSALNQSGNFSLEVLIIDDGSVDQTCQIVMNIKDSRLRLIKADHQGACAARNRGIHEARGIYIAFLDSDDIWLPDKLEKQIRFMEDRNSAFSYTAYEDIDCSGTPLGYITRGPGRITRRGMYRYCWPGCLTVMYDASKVGLVQIKPIHKNNDYALWLKVIRKADCYLLDECLARYLRGRSGSITTHGYRALIKWHYFLFRHSEGMSAPASFLLMCCNLLFGVLKKMLYVKRIENRK